MKSQEDIQAQSTLLINHIKYPSFVVKVKSLDDWQKLKVYLHYCIRNIAMKHSFEVVDMQKKNWQNGRSKPHKEFKGIAFYYHCQNETMQTLEQFCSDSNINVHDCGELWQKFGFAKRYKVEYSGIYDWYRKFENEFNFNNKS